jgi:hypothetical protein
VRSLVGEEIGLGVLGKPMLVKLRSFTHNEISYSKELPSPNEEKNLRTVLTYAAWPRGLKYEEETSDVRIARTLDVHIGKN